MAGALLWAELRRSWQVFGRYPVESVVTVVMMTLMFSGLILSAQYLAGPTAVFGDRLDGLMIGYAVWTLTVGVCGSLASDLQQEATSGTLEQLVMSRRPFALIQVYRALASLSIYLVMTTVVLFILAAISGTRFATGWGMLVPVMSLFAGAIGLALVLSALALLTKKVIAVMAGAQMLLMLLVMFPLEAGGGLSGFIHALPLTDSAALLRGVLVRGESLQYDNVAWSVVNSCCLLVLGVFACSAALRTAQRRATLGHY